MFGERQWAVGSYRLYNAGDVAGFTDNPVTVKCSNLVLKTLTPTLVVKVVDITAGNIEIMSSLAVAPFYPLTTTPYHNSASITSAIGSITSRTFTTLGFNA